jgi:glycosyltransferase involved in cell wall biosynthesis
VRSGDASSAKLVKHNDFNDVSATPLISVCIPMYNNGATIERCLRSIVDQDGVEFEIVVVDDDSSDGSAAIAATMLRPQDRLTRNGSRLGLNQNHNKCLELARGSYIQFVHGDDWLLPGALKTLARCFDDPTVGLAFAPRRVMSDDLEWVQRYGNQHTNFRNLQEFNSGLALVTQIALRGTRSNWMGEPSSVMFSRRLALSVGGFRDDIYQLVDFDLWLRLMLRSEVCFVSEKLSVRSHAATTETKRNAATRRSWIDHLRVLTWMIMDPASPPFIRILAGAYWVPTWLALTVEVVTYRPSRWMRMKTWAAAPVREFAHARRLRDGS